MVSKRIYHLCEGQTEKYFPQDQTFLSLGWPFDVNSDPQDISISPLHTGRFFYHMTLRLGVNKAMH